MPIRYQQTTDREIHEQVRRKRLAAIHELKSLGFEEYSFFGETVGAMGFNPLGLTGFLGVLISLFNEVSKVAGNLDVTIFNVVMASPEYATYAGPFGLGVKFYTGFTDGTFLISANFDTPAIQDEKERTYKFAKAETITSTWLSHRARVDKLCAQGKQKVEHLSFADYLQLMQREDKYMLDHKSSGASGVTVPSFLSVIMSISLLVSFVYISLLFSSLIQALYPTCLIVSEKTPLPQMTLIGVGCLALSWILARIQENTFLIDGIGTKMIGRSLVPGQTSYISTKWLVFVFLPILPVQSFLISGDASDDRLRVQYLAKHQPLPQIDWVQVRQAIGQSKLGYAILLLVLISISTLPVWKCL